MFVGAIFVWQHDDPPNTPCLIVYEDLTICKFSLFGNANLVLRIYYDNVICCYRSLLFEELLIGY